MSKYLPLPLKGPGVPPGVPQGQILDLYSNFAENFTRANYSKVSIKLKSCYMHTLPTKRQGWRLPKRVPMVAKDKVLKQSYAHLRSPYLCYETTSFHKRISNIWVLYISLFYATISQGFN